MTPRDAGCDNDDCERDGDGGWIHDEECDAESFSLPVVNFREAPKGSFLEYMAQHSLTRQVD